MERLPEDVGEKLAAAQASYEAAAAERSRAIVAAVAAGGSLREVAERAGTSHESVRRLLAEASGVELRHEGVRYPLSFHEATGLAAMLDAVAPRLRAEPAGERWADEAEGLAETLRDRLGRPEPLSLERSHAVVLRQLLLLGPPPRARMVRMLLELVAESVR